jgi:hypothetical protein
MDVTKIYWDIAYVEIVLHVCCKFLFPMLQLFLQTYVVSVCIRMLHMFYTYAVSVFIWMLYMFYMIFKCFCKCFRCMF